jgi:hypothetical protein
MSISESERTAIYEVTCDHGRSRTQRTKTVVGDDAPSVRPPIRHFKKCRGHAKLVLGYQRSILRPSLQHVSPACASLLVGPDACMQRDARAHFTLPGLDVLWLCPSALLLITWNTHAREGKAQAKSGTRSIPPELVSLELGSLIGQGSPSSPFPFAAAWRQTREMESLT